MDIVKQLIAAKGAEFISPLVQKLGLSEAQANTFLPIAVQAIVTKFMSDDKDESSSFSLAGLLGGGDESPVEKLVDGVDADAVAKEAGVAPATAKAGLKAIGPGVVDALKSQGVDAVLGMLGGKDSPLGGLGKLAGGLF